MYHKTILILTALSSLFLTACGGGGSSQGSNTTIPIVGTSQLSVDCAGQYCGATTSGYSNLSGSDIGIFSYFNDSSIPQSIDINIPMLSNGKAYAVLTNLENVNKSMSSVKLSIDNPATAFALEANTQQPPEQSEQLHAQLLKKKSRVIKHSTS